MPYDDPHILALQHKNPSAVELAEVVSLAVSVEPQLLRRARRELIPDADAGAEADVWLSSIVQSRGPSTIVLDGKAAHSLSNELHRRAPARFSQAWKLLRSHHSQAPLVTQLEEEINYLFAAPAEDTTDKVEQLLARVTVTLALNPGRRGLANWAARLLPRLPEQIRNLESAHAMAAATYVRLAGFIPEWPKGNQGVPGWLAWLLPRDFPERQVRVRFIGRGVEVSSRRPPSDAEDIPAEDVPAISLPATDPLLLEVSWSDRETRQSIRVELAPYAKSVVQTRATEVEFRTITGRRFLLRQQREEKQTMPEQKKTCYVSMGFGKKTDYYTGRVLDLDKSYRNIIKPAAEAAGLDCRRADEIPFSGVIDVPMYERLLQADVAIFDLSTSNPNALYELGLRHALRPYSTIVIAEDQMRFTFDLGNVPVRKYRHSGDGIDYEEVERMRSQLSGALERMLARPPQTDSPVYAFLTNLQPPYLQGPTSKSAKTVSPQSDVGATEVPPNPSLSVLVQQADSAIAKADFVTAIAVLKTARVTASSDPEVIRKLALATYRSALPTKADALKEARDLLQELRPSATNDTETLSLWATVHKRLWDATRNAADLDTAIWAYQKAFFLKDDYYNGINLAFLLDVRAAESSSLPEGVADAILAQRTRRHVIDLCTQAPEAATQTDDRHWLLAVLAEAWEGLGESARSREYVVQLQSSPTWMLQTTNDQLARLRNLLAQSPLHRLTSSPLVA